jgi:hypothetical protein
MAHNHHKHHSRDLRKPFGKSRNWHWVMLWKYTTNDEGADSRGCPIPRALALQLPFLKVSESMGNHDSKIVDAGGVD